MTWHESNESKEKTSNREARKGKDCNGRESKGGGRKAKESNGNRAKGNKRKRKGRTARTS